MNLQTTETKIIMALKQADEYLSGGELAQRLSISRQALWKHIGKLTDQGYKIVAAPHRGYRLESVPDKLYPWEVQEGLQASVFGKCIHHFESVGSTQDVLLELGKKGSPEGTLVVSERQKRGRGRLARTWLSPRGGIYVSLLFRPDFLLLSDIPQITLLVSLACACAIEKVTGLSTSVKWPNDIFLGTRKVGGILCEVNAEQDKVHFLAVGVGINVNTKDLPATATSLFLRGKKKVSRVTLLRHMVEEIERLYHNARSQGFAAIRKSWSDRCFLWGKQVTVQLSSSTISGYAVGIATQGYLRLRGEDGSFMTIAAGDVTKIRPSR